MNDITSFGLVEQSIVSSARQGNLDNPVVWCVCKNTIEGIIFGVFENILNLNLY